MLNMVKLRAVAVIALATLGLSACLAGNSVENAVAEVQSRDNMFPSYPQAGNTYLSYSGPHGFQVEYVAHGGRSWLWYPGNRNGVPSEWKLETIRGIKAICFRHPASSYNPVTRSGGGGWGCQELVLSQKSTVARLSGDPFNLRLGTVPYQLNRCNAPDQFSFDREKFSC